MPIFVVTYEHPDNEGWQHHLMPHLTWLQQCIADGSLIASGPFRDSSVKSALLIMSAPDRATVESLIETDPFAIEGLIANMTIQVWDPIFGILNDRSSMPKSA
jgi:hypothetical protein